MKKDQYYFLDIDTESMEVLSYGETPKATLTGKTDKANVHRVFLTKGQFNKLVKRLRG